ncbi:hypothetical protein L6452_11053 [Arctium lappa]|uniref:Uncharacterized protein n=1 Tax=Arctium lappa TaxID=4217 RepID=A0ACB9DNV2_ARCLA|nr:hypothetical protein L6452_11053 [Arctium lappa]
MIKLLTRYQSHKQMEEHTRISAHKQKLESEHVFTADELTQMIKWHLEENNIQLLDITGLNQLEQQLDSILQQVRIRKTQQMLEVVKALQEEEMRLKKERNFMIEEIMAARSDAMNDDSGDPSEPQLPVMELRLSGDGCV